LTLRRDILRSLSQHATGRALESWHVPCSPSRDCQCASFDHGPDVPVFAADSCSQAATYQGCFGARWRLTDQRRRVQNRPGEPCPGPPSANPASVPPGTLHFSDFELRALRLVTQLEALCSEAPRIQLQATLSSLGPGAARGNTQPTRQLKCLNLESQPVWRSPSGTTRRPTRYVAARSLGPCGRRFRLFSRDREHPSRVCPGDGPGCGGHGRRIVASQRSTCPGKSAISRQLCPRPGTHLRQGGPNYYLNSHRGWGLLLATGDTTWPPPLTLPGGSPAPISPKRDIIFDPARQRIHEEAAPLPAASNDQGRGRGRFAATLIRVAASLHSVARSAAGGWPRAEGSAREWSRRRRRARLPRGPVRPCELDETGHTDNDDACKVARVAVGRVA
jgi:hypothetical protein